MATLTVTPQVSKGRVKITVAGTNITEMTLWREVPGSQAERVQYFEDGSVVPNGGDVYDYEMPLQVTYKYYAVTTEGGSPVTSPKVSTTVNDTKDWLKNPDQPNLNMPVNVQTLPQLTFSVESSTQWVQSRQDPVVISGVRRTPTAELTLVTLEDSDRGDLGALLGSSSVLLLSTPKAHGVGNVYLAIGDVTQSRVSPFAKEPVRTWSMSVTEVQRPVSDFDSPPLELMTYNRAADIFDTYDSVPPSLTYNDIAKGITTPKAKAPDWMTA